MKFCLIIISIFLLNVSSAQDDWNIRYVVMGGGSNAERAFHIKGEKATCFVNYLFEKYPDKKRKGYIHKFSNYSIPNINGLLFLKVQEGVHGIREDGANTFNTFTSEKYRRNRLNRRTDDDVLGVIIYVKKKRKNYIHTSDETKAFITHVSAVCEN